MFEDGDMFEVGDIIVYNHMRYFLIVKKHHTVGLYCAYDLQKNFIFPRIGFYKYIKLC